MQLKKIKPGVVYAEHGPSDYQRHNGTPTIVLDPTIWERENGHSATTYRRAPGEPAGRPDTWSRRLRGAPVLTLGTTDDVSAATLEEFESVGKAVADQLAAHQDRRPFDVELPDIGGYSVRFGLVNPRDIRAEWTAYAAGRKVEQEREAAAREQRQAAAERQAAATTAAHARIAAVLPGAEVLTAFGRVPERPTLSWVQLAELLDAYADARPAR